MSAPNQVVEIDPPAALPPEAGLAATVLVGTERVFGYGHESLRDRS